MIKYDIRCRTSVVKFEKMKKVDIRCPGYSIKCAQRQKIFELLPLGERKASCDKYAIIFRLCSLGEHKTWYDTNSEVADKF